MKTSKQEHGGKRLLVFAVAGYNLAETGRMIEIAKAARPFFRVRFLSYGGQFEELIEEEGFALEKMEPRLTRRKLDQLRVVLSGETLNTVGYFSAAELAPRVENEIALFERLQPVAVLTGWCLSVTLSARAAGVPLVNVLHSTSVREYYEAGLQSWPDRRDFPLVRWLFGNDVERMNRWVSRLVLKLAAPARAYNIVGQRYGLPRFKNFIDLIEGDHTLLADVPEWVGFPKIRPSLHYVGPLPARINRPVPDEVAAMPRDKPIVYFAMGSSGKPKLICDIIKGFKDRPYRVIAPVKRLVREHERRGAAECRPDRIPARAQGESHGRRIGDSWRPEHRDERLPVGNADRRSRNASGATGQFGRMCQKGFCRPAEQANGDGARGARRR